MPRQNSQELSRYWLQISWAFTTCASLSASFFNSDLSAAYVAFIFSSSLVVRLSEHIARDKSPPVSAARRHGSSSFESAWTIPLSTHSKDDVTMYLMTFNVRLSGAPSRRVRLKARVRGFSSCYCPPDNKTNRHKQHEIPQWHPKKTECCS